MSSNTIAAAPVLNRNSSDDEILGLSTHLPRRNGRREANADEREATAQVAEPVTDEQLEIDFGARASSESSWAKFRDAGGNRRNERAQANARAGAFAGGAGCKS